jgi:NAD(P)-dependent dehydrogenase (short-subunit alcohol dehydrogenase family)
VSLATGQFEGRVVVITGAGAGIGRATALVLAERGATVIAVDAVGERAEAVALEARARGARSSAITCDVGSEEEVRRSFAAVADEFGTLDALVTSAGVGADGVAHDLSQQAWNRTITTNLFGTFVSCKHAIRSLLEANKPGSIVCVSSPAAFAAIPALPAYSAAKGGVSALVRVLARDYAPYGIRVNALVPGATETELMWANAPQAEIGGLRKQLASEIPLGRLAEPTEIAYGAAWLLSDEASYVTGSHLVCDGGVLASTTLSA